MLCDNEGGGGVGLAQHDVNLNYDGVGRQSPPFIGDRN